MVGQGFAIAKRHVAMFCVGLCVALSVQMTVVMLDQLQHALNIEHAPNGLAGYIVFHDRGVPPHSHPLGSDGGPVHGHHMHGGLPDDHDSLAHHHYGNGMLAPWLVSPTFVFAASPLPNPDYDYIPTTHPDAPAWRRDRPPKLNLERIA